ncbi:MAG: hypothetical protein HDQ88_05470 [Clostridia bacterium]|nr:hypothetical protein [Clostridia bacterium]
MKVDILDMNQLIKKNDLQQVTSSQLLSSEMFDDDGIMSYRIFGTSTNDRRRTFGYIDLRKHFIHPHIYINILARSVFQNIVPLIAGQKRYIVEDGFLKEDPYGWTGVTELYRHWNEIDWNKSPSTNKIGKKILTELPRDRVFVKFWPVIPPSYRDIMLGNDGKPREGAVTKKTSDVTSDLNTLYQALIRAVNVLSTGGIFKDMQYAAEARVQNDLNEIFNYFKDRLTHKNGLIRKSLLGKSVDYGARVVISAPTFRHDKFEDAMVDYNHAALPIATAAATFYPFVESYIRDFFNQAIGTNPNLFSYTNPTTGHQETLSLEDAEIQFSEKNIKKIINNYIPNPDNRFDPVTVTFAIPAKDGKKKKKELVIMMNDAYEIGKDGSKTKVIRPMTLTDLMFMATVDAAEHRHIMISRHPVGTDKGIILNKPRIRSTNDTIHMEVNGIDYPRYPIIDHTIPHNKVATQFVDSTTYSNEHLKEMSADYDGDQIFVRGVWSDEANDEVEDLMTNNKMTALRIGGTNPKVISGEVFNAFYELTKEGPDPKQLSENDTTEALELSPEMITLSLLTSYFATTTTISEDGKRSTKSKPARYRTWDKITIPKDYFYKGQEEIKSTIGRFIANKFVLQGSGFIQLSHYINTIWNGGWISNFNNVVSDYFMKDEINREQFQQYLNRRDTLGFWLNGMLAHSISPKFSKPIPEVEKLKKELLKKYEKELKAGDLDTMIKIQNTLVAKAKEILKDDPGMDLYLCGDLNFDNNYRANAIIKGPVPNKITGEFDFIDTSFMDGIKIKDLPVHANSILAAQYPASIATQDAGYLGKKLMSLMQMMGIGPAGSDCGTKQLIPLDITEKNANEVIYTWIKDGKGLKLLTPDNVKSYIGKRVMMRSPMTCLDEKICSKCAGQLFYMLDVKNPGLFSVQISYADLNLGLKTKHDTTVKLYRIDPEKVVRDV